MDPQDLLTHTLRTAPWGERVAAVMAAALDAVEPGAAVRRYLRRVGDLLIAGGRSYDLRAVERVLLVAVGKAGLPMARAAADLLGDALTEGIVVVKADHTPETESQDKETRRQGDRETAIQAPDLPFSLSPGLPVSVIAAGHPVPDERGVAAARRVAALLESATARDLALVLISGGGSALLTLPAPGIELADLQVLTGMLLASGASIDEINCLRKHLDLVKGGGLARMAAPAPVITLILSDVVGSSLDVIASGPTVADSTTFADAWAVLERYGLLRQAPPAIVAHLKAGRSGQRAETLKDNDPALAAVQHVLVGSNAQAAMAALERARAEGFHTLLLTTYAQGEARVVGRLLGAVAREIHASGQPLPRPACIVAGGETTVTLRGSGHGGRNQELALAAVAELAGLPDVALVSLATDGGDGPTDAAGAVVTGTTLARARALGRDPAAALANNDAYPFFAALGDLLRPGPTHTNVNDLVFLFAF